MRRIGITLMFLRWETICSVSAGGSAGYSFDACLYGNPTSLRRILYVRSLIQTIQIKTNAIKTIDNHTQPLFQICMKKGRARPVNPIIRKAINMISRVDSDSSSMARIRAKSVSLRTLNAMVAELPCARKKVIADKTCRNINHRIRVATIENSSLIRDI